MKSKCCKSEIIIQDGTPFCNHCVRILSIEESIRSYYSLYCILLVVLFTLLSFKSYCPSNELIQVSYEVNIDNIILIESNGKINVVSNQGAIGLMQITKIGLKHYNKVNKTNLNKNHLYNKDININIGKWYLEKEIPRVLKLYNIPITVTNVLISYNWGVNNTIKWYKAGGNINKLPKETRSYLLKYWSKF